MFVDIKGVTDGALFEDTRALIYVKFEIYYALSVFFRRDKRECIICPDQAY